MGSEAPWFRPHEMYHNPPPYWTPGLTIIIDPLDWLSVDAAFSRFGFFVDLGPFYFELAWWKSAREQPSAARK